MRIQHGSPFTCVLNKLENGGQPRPIGDRMMEFHIHAAIRSALGIGSALFMTTGNLIIPDFSAARSLADKLRGMKKVTGQDSTKLSAGRLNAMGLIDEILHIVVGIYRERVMPDVIERLSSSAIDAIGRPEYEVLLREFSTQFPPSDVYKGTSGIEDWLESRSTVKESGPAVPNRELAFEELLLLKLANENQAFAPFRFLFDDGLRPGARKPETIGAKTKYSEAFEAIEKASRALPPFGPAGGAVDLIELLRMPAKAAPDSLEAQLSWIRENWGATFDEIGLRILKSLDFIREEETPRFPPGPGPAAAYTYKSSSHEYEKFTQDKDWMPSLVLMAKNALVWLDQLSETYGRPIRRLDEIPDQELDTLAARGINGLWLIGIWQRSPASEKIKRYCGNPEAAASAYSLFDYDIASELGGWEALDSLRSRCLWRGIRLAADMVPNHTGMDSAWIRERPELFIGSDHCPYPGYSFNGPDLSADQSVGLWLEDHYYTKTDAAVVFKRLDRRNGRVRYIYHGNDGTGMAWNDTAQIDFLNPEARAAVKEKILHVARHFSVIRFDAAMVLAKQHVRRLWYPAPGAGGAIPTRAEHSMSDEAFDRAIPHEFWREVVDECAEQAPDTLLLAEAFWMMEGYFTRTLGMHRVYNSAFMNMLKDEKNSLYRLTIKNTQEFDKEILKRFVNFMSNPDEQTAVAQFGSGDKYFGVCTMLATMPGMPMIGHGQIEGFTEKYGMEYTKAYKDEKPDQVLVDRHEKEIFPLLRMRKLFAEVEHFHLFDFITDEGHVDENVFAYSNGRGEEDRALIFYNNCWKRSAGRIALSCPYTEKAENGKKRLRTKSIAQALGLDPGPGNYLAARELRSELWHLFRCSDLESQGWHVELEGYQTLVFAELSRVHDMGGNYERLWTTLRGKGIADLDDALEEASRPELYHALEKAIGALRTFAKKLSEDGLDTEAVAHAGQNSEAYFSKLALAIDEDGGPGPGLAAVLKGRAVIESGLSIIDAIVRYLPESGLESLLSSETLSRLAAALGSKKGIFTFLNYILIAALSKMNPGANQSEELRYLLEKFLVKKKLLRAAEESETEFSPEAAPASAAGTTAPAATAPPSAIDALDPKTLCSIAFAFASRPRDSGWLQGGTSGPAFSLSAKARAAELVRWAIADHEARAALGINIWDDVEYFNRERFDALLTLWPCFALLEGEFARMGPAAKRSETDTLKSLADSPDVRAFEVSDIVRQAEAASRYRTAALVSQLEND